MAVVSLICSRDYSSCCNFIPGKGEDVLEGAVAAENFAANGAASASQPSADWMKNAVDSETVEGEPEMKQPDTDTEGMEEETAEDDAVVDVE